MRHLDTLQLHAKARLRCGRGGRHGLNTRRFAESFRDDRLADFDRILNGRAETLDADGLLGEEETQSDVDVESCGVIGGDPDLVGGGWLLVAIALAQRCFGGGSCARWWSDCQTERRQCGWRGSAEKDTGSMHQIMSLQRPARSSLSLSCTDQTVRRATLPTLALVLLSLLR